MSSVAESSLTLWLLPMEFTVRTLDETEPEIETTDDPEDLVFVVGRPRVLVCPTTRDRQARGRPGGWRALLVEWPPDSDRRLAVTSALQAVETVDPDSFTVSSWTQTYLLLRHDSFERARDALISRQHTVFELATSRR